MNIELKENSIVKDGEEIAVYNPETNTVLSKKDIAPTVKGAITNLLTEAFNLEDKPSYDVAPENAPQAPQKAKKHANPEPPRTIQAGDKTPAYMKWYRDTHGEEAFLAKYGQRICELDGEKFGPNKPFVSEPVETFEP